MRGITMSNIVAKHPRVFSFFYFFFVNTFFSFFLTSTRRIYSTPRPVYFHWNFLLDNKNNSYFHWNNIVLSKNKKEERTLIRNPYINLCERMKK